MPSWQRFNSSEGKKHASQRNKMKMILGYALWYKVQDTVKFDFQELCLQTMAAISERTTSKNFQPSSCEVTNQNLRL